MARISFYLPDGSEKSVRLFSDRTLRIGREPTSDAILRDAKVSRRHAEVNFERGFYVIRDVGSANGTWVNGRRVRVAPLTDGAELRLGATRARFSEELAEEERGDSTVDAPRIEGSVLETEPPDAGTVDLRPTVPDPVQPPQPDPLHTQPHQVDDFGRPSKPAEESEPDKKPSERATASRVDPPPHLSTRIDPDPRFRHPRYVIDSSRHDCGVVRDPRDEPLFYYRPPLSGATFVAGIVTFLMVLAGVATTLLLAFAGDAVPALMAFTLTAAFTTLIVALIPRRTVELYDDEAMQSVRLVIWQESRSPFPRLRFSAREPDGRTIAFFDKSFLSNLGRRQWWIYAPHDPQPVGTACDDSLSRALIRKFAGGISSSLTTDFLFETAGQIAARLTRRASAMYRTLLVVEHHRAPLLDARILVAMAVLLEGIERR